MTESHKMKSTLNNYAYVNKSTENFSVNAPDT